MCFSTQAEISRVGVVVELMDEPQWFASPAQFDMLMRLVVPRVRTGPYRHLLVTAQLMLEETEVPGLGVSAVADPPAEEVILHVEVEPVRLVAGSPPGDLLGKFGDHHLIGVDDEDPLVAKREVLQGPILLLGIRPVEMKLDDACPELCGDGRGFIGALAVDDEDLVSPRQREEAAAQFAASFLTGTITLTLTLPSGGGVSWSEFMPPVSDCASLVSSRDIGSAPKLSQALASSKEGDREDRTDLTSIRPQIQGVSTDRNGARAWKPAQGSWSSPSTASGGVPPPLIQR